MCHLEVLFRVAALANVRGDVAVSRPQAQVQRRWFVYYLVVVIAALVLTWPIIVDGQSPRCGLLSAGVAAMLLASLVHLGAAKGAGRWIWGTIATVLAFAAPFSFELCMNENGLLRSWWIGAGFIFIGLVALIVWQSARDWE